MAIKIWPYRQGSASARALATALNGRVLRRVGGTYRPRPGDTVINWGDPDPPAHVTKNRSGLRQASNKLEFFRLLRGTGVTPDYWETPNDIPDDAFPIVCRTELAGHSGAGIVIAATRADLVPARLYVRYKKKQHEYRVHLGRTNLRSDEIVTISVQRKALRNGAENPNHQIRNHANGFVYVRGDVDPPAAVFDVAQQALRATLLDFGAVDVIWNNREQRAYVLEINTAPGLEGQTVVDYSTFFVSTLLNR